MQLHEISVPLGATQMNLAFFDTETGGLDPRRNPLLSLGAVVTGGDAFEASIQPDPTLIIEKEAADVNGWPWHDRSLYPEKEVILAFSDWLKAHKIKFLVAHNAPFDYGFLGAAFSRSGLSVNSMPRFLCTMSIAHVLQLQGKLNTATLSLNNVAKSLNLRVTRGEHHGALEDATIVEQVYEAMTKPPTPVVPVTQGPRRRTGLGWGGGM